LGNTYTDEMRLKLD